MKTRHAALCIFALSGCFGLASAQDLAPLIAECASGGSPELLTSCQSSSLAIQAVRGGVGLADRMGADLAGAPSTIGRRLSAPRVSLDIRLRMTRFAMPNLLGGGTGIAGENSVNAYAVTGSFAVGLLDGFSLMSTVGGLLSLDLLGSASLVFLGESDGFPDNEGIFSVGGRLGILRESFTLPGVTVSAVQSFGQNVDWTAPAVSGPQMDADISTTSVRATIGKDFFTLAVLGGIGWNWDRGEMGIEVSDPTIPGGQGIGRMDGLTTRRTIYFAGISITRLVYQFSLEGGWAAGYDELSGYPGAYDPGQTTPFISVAGRLTI